MKKVNRSLKVIVDTNIWISFLIGKSLKGLQEHIDSETIQIITCDEQIQELITVFRKPKIKKYFSPQQINDFFDLFDELSLNIAIKTKIYACRDAKDNYLLSLAIDSNADYLITGDIDLLILTSIENTNIIKFIDFEKNHLIV
jgi:putative PIN family toxin of toxin-antitoxin system